VLFQIEMWLFGMLYFIDSYRIYFVNYRLEEQKVSIVIVEEKRHKTGSQQFY